MIKRRNVLTMLGLAPVGATFSTDALAGLPESTHKVAAGYEFKTERFVSALRNLATAAENGEISVFGMDVVSKLERDDLIKHNMSIVFSYKDSREI